MNHGCSSLLRRVQKLAGASSAFLEKLNLVSVMITTETFGFELLKVNAHVTRHTSHVVRAESRARWPLSVLTPKLQRNPS